MIPLITTLQDFPSQFKGGVVAVGNFDGVHLGHASLVARIVQTASAVNGPAVVITFDPPPITLLRPDVPLLPPITTLTRRAELLEKLGVSCLLALPTSQQLLNLSPVRFFEQILVDTLQIRGMVEGPNFRFGKDRAGDVVLLDALCQRAGLRFQVAESVDDSVGMISSSRIRGLIAEGKVDSANSMLTEPFQISGIVTRGSGRGAVLGFPTANIEPVHSLAPPHGVYAGQVAIDGRSFAAAVNIGPNPTFGEQRSKVEVHIIGFQQDLYGRHLACGLIKKVREVVRFSSKEELLQQISRDIASVRNLVDEFGRE